MQILYLIKEIREKKKIDRLQILSTINGQTESTYQVVGSINTCRILILLLLLLTICCRIIVTLVLLIHPHIREKGVGYFTYHEGKILERLCKEYCFLV